MGAGCRGEEVGLGDVDAGCGSDNLRFIVLGMVGRGAVCFCFLWRAGGCCEGSFGGWVIWRREVGGCAGFVGKGCAMWLISRVEVWRGVTTLLLLRRNL